MTRFVARVVVRSAVRSVVGRLPLPVCRRGPAASPARSRWISTGPDPPAGAPCAESVDLRVGQAEVGGSASRSSRGLSPVVRLSPSEVSGRRVSQAKRMLWTSSVGSGRWFTFAARGAGPACCLLAEAGDVGVRWSCVPVCHTRESALVDGAVENSPETGGGAERWPRSRLLRPADHVGDARPKTPSALSADLPLATQGRRSSSPSPLSWFPYRDLVADGAAVRQAGDLPAKSSW
jgi:hypothetical protein